MASFSLCCEWGEHGVLPVHLLGSEQKTALRLGSVALAIRTRRLSPNLLFLRCLLASLNLEHHALSITRVSEGATQQLATQCLAQSSHVKNARGRKIKWNLLMVSEANVAYSLQIFIK